jgi:uncharacterized protein (DUF3820 family)
LCSVPRRHFTGCTEVAAQDQGGGDPSEMLSRMAAELKEIELGRMPFGKFGPENFPPEGVPLFDLPAEYLGWFAERGGFPKGRLGHLMRVVYQMKVDGLDGVFDGMRARRGGRTRLRGGV